MTTAPSIAAFLSTGEPQRLYSGLSVLVSAAADGERCAALASFGALEMLLDGDLARRAQVPEHAPALSWEGRETFARSLVELVETAREMEELPMWACAASVETMALTDGDIEGQLDGVISTPRFLRDNAGARLLFV